jgi:hypothetical protein
MPRKLLVAGSTKHTAAKLPRLGLLAVPGRPAYMLGIELAARCKLAIRSTLLSASAGAPPAAAAALRPAAAPAPQRPPGLSFPRSVPAMFAIWSSVPFMRSARGLSAGIGWFTGPTRLSQTANAWSCSHTQHKGDTQSKQNKGLTGLTRSYAGKEPLESDTGSAHVCPKITHSSHAWLQHVYACGKRPP